MGNISSTLTVKMNALVVGNSDNGNAVLFIDGSVVHPGGVSGHSRVIVMVRSLIVLSKQLQVAWL